MQIEQLKPIIEAALLASTQPMTVQQLGELFNEADDVNREQIAKALEALAEDCTGRGIELKEVASGFRYQVRQDVHPWISRMWTERPSRYSRALLETLALIAYRQPITRGEIEQIRGVATNSNIIKALEEREWIRVVGHRDVPGKPALFGTTKAFLDYFGLKRLDELPPLSELKDIGELEPQLPLDGAPLPVSIASGDAADADQEGNAFDRSTPDGSTPDESTPVADDDGDTDDEQHDTTASDDADEDTASDDAGDDAGDHDEPQPEDDDAAASDQEDRAPSEQKQ